MRLSRKQRHRVPNAALHERMPLRSYRFELMHVEIPFLPVAARIERGHHLRLSLAGTDHDNFAMLTETPATWEIAYGGSRGSTLRVPVRAWR